MVSLMFETIIWVEIGGGEEQKGETCEESIRTGQVGARPWALTAGLGGGAKRTAQMQTHLTAEPTGLAAGFGGKRKRRPNSGWQVFGPGCWGKSLHLGGHHGWSRELVRSENSSFASLCVWCEKPVSSLHEGIRCEMLALGGGCRLEGHPWTFRVPVSPQGSSPFSARCGWWGSALIHTLRSCPTDKPFLCPRA